MRRTLYHIVLNLFLLSFTALGIAEYLDWTDDDPGEDAAIVSFYESAGKVVAHRAKPRVHKLPPEKGSPLADFKPSVLSPMPSAAGQELLHLLRLQRK